MRQRRKGAAATIMRQWSAIIKTVKTAFILEIFQSIFISFYLSCDQRTQNSFAMRWWIQLQHANVRIARKKDNRVENSELNSKEIHLAVIHVRSYETTESSSRRRECEQEIGKLAEITLRKSLINFVKIKLCRADEESARLIENLHNW